MSAGNFTSVLYRQLPEVYRNRDNPARAADGSIRAPGDLANLLDCYGDLQGALYRTLLQRYYDIFPDQEGVDDEGLPRGCQSWVLPYLAQLLGNPPPYQAAAPGGPPDKGQPGSPDQGAGANGSGPTEGTQKATADVLAKDDSKGGMPSPAKPAEAPGPK